MTRLLPIFRLGSSLRATSVAIVLDETPRRRAASATLHAKTPSDPTSHLSAALGYGMLLDAG